MSRRSISPLLAPLELTVSTDNLWQIDGLPDNEKMTQCVCESIQNEHGLIGRRAFQGVKPGPPAPSRLLVSVSFYWAGSVQVGRSTYSDSPCGADVVPMGRGGSVPAAWGRSRARQVAGSMVTGE